MKLTSRKLRQLIREELSRTLLEMPYDEALEDEMPEDEAPYPSVDVPVGVLQAASQDILMNHRLLGVFPMTYAYDTPDSITFSTDKSVTATQSDREDAQYAADRARTNLEADALEWVERTGHKYGLKDAKVRVEPEDDVKPEDDVVTIIISYS